MKSITATVLTALFLAACQPTPEVPEAVDGDSVAAAARWAIYIERDPFTDELTQLASWLDNSETFPPGETTSLRLYADCTDSRWKLAVSGELFANRNVRIRFDDDPEENAEWNLGLEGIQLIPTNTTAFLRRMTQHEALWLGVTRDDRRRNRDIAARFDLTGTAYMLERLGWDLESGERGFSCPL